MTIRRTNLIICQEKWKELRFWKWSSKSCRIFWQNLMFWAATFFQVALGNFCELYDNVEGTSSMIQFTFCYDFELLFQQLFMIHALWREDKLSVGGNFSSLLDDKHLYIILDVRSNNFGEAGREKFEITGDEARDKLKYLPPINFGSGRTAIAISVGRTHVCAILDNDSTKCWGYLFSSNTLFNLVNILIWGAVRMVN